MTLDELLAVAEIVEKLTNRYRDQEAAHKAALTEIRASFNARTSADEKIIEGLRAEIIRVNEAHGRTKVENDGLRDELTAQRDAFTAEVERIRRELHEGRDALRAEVAALQERLRASIARGDFAQIEVAALKSQTPKHPVKVGEWVRRLMPSPSCAVGAVAKVMRIDDDASMVEYTVERIDGQKGVWFAQNCEPCDPPNHDTAQGKAAAESAVKEPIKVGDVAKVVGASGDLTAQSDIGKIGEVLKTDSQDGTVLLSGGAGWVDHRDVRKVTT